MKNRFAAVLLILAIAVMFPAVAVAQDTGSTKYDLDKVESVVVEALNKLNVDKLTQESSAVFAKYKFSDADVKQLSDETKTFTTALDNYAKAYKAAPASKKVPAPHDVLNTYCTQLKAFLDKYKVTCEDILTVSKSAALMLMNSKEDPKKGGDSPAKVVDSDVKLPTQDEVNAAFDSLIAFSQKYNIMAADLVPVINSISDIGLTVLENRVDIQKASKTEGYWRTKLTAFGASKDQADNLFKSVMGLKRKYNIKTADIKNLGSQLCTQLKINPTSDGEKDADKSTDSTSDKTTDK
jgi:uncharacterized protein YoxC